MKIHSQLIFIVFLAVYFGTLNASYATLNPENNRSLNYLFGTTANNSVNNDEKPTKKTDANLTVKKNSNEDEKENKPKANSYSQQKKTSHMLELIIKIQNQWIIWIDGQEFREPASPDSYQIDYDYLHNNPYTTSVKFISNNKTKLVLVGDKFSW